METCYVRDVRNEFIDLYKDAAVAENGTVEIVNANFIADEETIFGTLNKTYANAELEWYLSQSLHVDDIPGKVPKIWKDVSSNNGKINSNYGWCIFSEANYNQYEAALKNLFADKSSRQAQMIYTRPTMHADAVVDGMHDFMCTAATQLLIREDKLHYIVMMRSSDAVFGYKNDRYWHDYVHNKALNDLRQGGYQHVEKGNLYWNAGSLHVYPRHFGLIEKYIL